MVKLCFRSGDILDCDSHFRYSVNNYINNKIGGSCMAHIRFDYSKALAFFGEHELTYLQDAVKGSTSFIT